MEDLEATWLGARRKGDNKGISNATPNPKAIWKTEWLSVGAALGSEFLPACGTCYEARGESLCEGREVADLLVGSRLPISPRVGVAIPNGCPPLLPQAPPFTLTGALFQIER